jgi:RNA polymerase sigma factor (sigma-70 family)
MPEFGPTFGNKDENNKINLAPGALFDDGGLEDFLHEITKGTGVGKDEVFNREDKDTYKVLNDLLNSISPTEREIIEYYYGLGIGERFKLKDIGEHFGGMSEGTILRHKQKGLQKIRVKIGKNIVE